MFSKDYLVICGRASARSMESVSATLESPLDSSKNIIAKLRCAVQRFLMQKLQMQKLQLSASLVHPSEVLSASAWLPLHDGQTTSDVSPVLRYNLFCGLTIITVVIRRASSTMVPCLPR
jgi:hypothetical protein